MSPAPAEIRAAREAYQQHHAIGITAAQRECAAMVSRGIRAWQTWETGTRKMPAGTWELWQEKGKKFLPQCK